LTNVKGNAWAKQNFRMNSRSFASPYISTAPMLNTHPTYLFLKLLPTPNFP
jgi:hypothetical protein